MDCVRQRIATSENVEPVTSTACAAPRRTPSSAAAATSRPTAQEDERTLLAAYNYENSLIGMERNKEAKSLLRKTIPMARRVLGESNELTLKMEANYGSALVNADGATLDDLREAVTTLEDAGRTARRVLGGAHPHTTGIERALRVARAALRARETPPELDSDCDVGID